LQHIDPCVNRFSGVYFLCDADEVVYVGQSVAVLSRIMTHVMERNKRFDPDRIFFLPVPQSELLRAEGEFIRLLKPKYNGNPSLAITA
jgi:excinuclease UvrABC nuclease subunit